MPPSRSLFEEFSFMRTKSLQSKMFADEELRREGEDDRVSLLRSEEGDIRVIQVPVWAGKVEGLNYQITRLETKVTELDTLHVRHLSRPPVDVDEGDMEEKIIQKLTQETTQMFSSSQKQVAALQSSCRRMLGVEKVVVGNIVTNLVNRLQEITDRFRSSQANYLRRVEAREKMSSDYFTTDLLGNEEEDGLRSEYWTKQDMMQLNDQTSYLTKRDQEIKDIVQSIQDMNIIFKELASMVSDQGEVVDRIDYNIENTGIKVEEGLKQLQKASKHQQRNFKMKCIFCMAPSLILLLLLLIGMKS